MPDSQDIELSQLDSETLEESFQGELGGCIDIVEHDTWRGRREEDSGVCVCQGQTLWFQPNEVFGTQSKEDLSI